MQCGSTNSYLLHKGCRDDYYTFQIDIDLVIERLTSMMERLNLSRCVVYVRLMLSKLANNTYPGDCGILGVEASPARVKQGWPHSSPSRSTAWRTVGKGHPRNNILLEARRCKGHPTE
jgi:hypothetical protein